MLWVSRRLVFVPILLVMAGGLWAAGRQEKTAAVGAPVLIRWARPANVIDPATDRRMLELQRITNTKIEILGWPWDVYRQKVALAISSGDPMEIINYDPGRELNGWVANGLVLPLDENLATGNYPNLKALIDAAMYKPLKYNGKAYYKPLPLAPSARGGIIRKDWLDKVGLGIPRTVNDFYEVAKAFARRDPDGDGKDDTYGMFCMDSAFAFDQIQRAYVIAAGEPNIWVALPDGTVTRAEATKDLKESVRFLRKIHQEGLVNQDWPTLKYDQAAESDQFAAGKFGFFFATNPALHIGKLLKMEPRADLAYFPPLEGAVAGVPTNIGHFGGMWFGSLLPKSNKNPTKTLQLIEYCLTLEGRTLEQYGIKGIHYTSARQDAGNRIFSVVKEELDKDWDTKTQGYRYPLSFNNLSYFENSYIPIKEYGFDFDKAFLHMEAWGNEDDAKNPIIMNWVKTNAQYAVLPPLRNAYMEELMKDQNKLQSIYDQGFMKAIVGTGDFDQVWDAMVKEWLAAGGAALIKAGNDYNKTLQAGK